MEYLLQPIIALFQDPYVAAYATILAISCTATAFLVWKKPSSLIWKYVDFFWILGGVLVGIFALYALQKSKIENLASTLDTQIQERNFDLRQRTIAEFTGKCGPEFDYKIIKAATVSYIESYTQQVLNPIKEEVGNETFTHCLKFAALRRALMVAHNSVEPFRQLNTQNYPYVELESPVLQTYELFELNNKIKSGRHFPQSIDPNNFNENELEKALRETTIDISRINSRVQSIRRLDYDLNSPINSDHYRIIPFFILFIIFPFRAGKSISEILLVKRSRNNHQKRRKPARLIRQARVIFAGFAKRYRT